MKNSKSGLVLQYRWRVVDKGGEPHLLYYGVRNPPYHRKQLLPVSRELAGCLASGAPLAENAETRSLAEIGALVPPEEKRPEKSRETMQVCTRCVNNDFVIPGLEFDDKGVCALCQCYTQADEPARASFAVIEENELLETAKKNKTSRFDAMVLYTGGKDSSYMLWLLARRMKLRVLAAFWDMPWCTKAAYSNIERAKAMMPEVEFIEWTLPRDKVRAAMREKWHVHGWPCLCPTAAFPLFYPLACQLRVPFVFMGLEDVQAAVMDYVFPADGNSSTLPASPREQTLAFLSARALPREQIQPVFLRQEMANYHAAVNRTMPDLFADLADIVRRARQDNSVFMPLIGRIKTTREYGTWEEARNIIEREMGWQAPSGQNSLLHTSCMIEPVKDYLQLQRFKAMKTVFLPQSMVETGAAVFFGMTGRAEALHTVDELGYWKPPAILDKLAADLGITPENVLNSDDELRSGMLEWENCKQATANATV